jgi:hypothetical protein
MKPAALREVRVVRVEEGGALVLSGARGEVVVEPLEAAIWQAADGTLEVSALAEIAGAALGQRVEVWEVWSALDVLGELGLMAEVAAAPPAAVGRRDALRWFGQAAGAAALLVMGAGQARAEDAVKAAEAVPEDAQPVPADAPEAKKRQEAQAKQREARKREEADTKAKRQEEKKKRDLASDKEKEVRQEEREKKANINKDRTAADAPPSDAEAKKRSEYEAKKADDRATPVKKKQVDGKQEARSEEDAKKQEVQ